MFGLEEILQIIIQFHIALCMDIPAPVNLSISSQYFVHLLSWSMGPGSPDGVHYTVKTRTVSDQLVVCEKVTSPLRCNLTKAFYDPEDTYYTSVTAVLGNQTSPPAYYSPFRPIDNTLLEPPHLSVTACNTSLCVSLKAPSPELHDIYNSFLFNYRLNITSEDGAEFHTDTEGLKSVILTDLVPGHRYCVNVSIIDRRSTRRPPVCASTTKAENMPDVLIFVVLCLLMMLFVMCIIPRLVCRFFLKEDLPAVLSSFHSHYKVKALLIPTAESLSQLSEDTGSLQKITRTTEEHEETEGEAEEEGVMYESLATHIQAQDSHASSTSIFPQSSGSGFLINQIPETHPRCTSNMDGQCSSCSVYEGGLTVRLEFNHLPQETHPLLNSSSAFPSHLEQEDSGGVEDETNINLFSVTLGGVLEEQLEAETCSNTDELEPRTDDWSPTANHSSGSPAHSSDHISDSEERDDEYSGYLSRN